MAVGVLRAMEQIVFDDTGSLFLGELGLDGTLRHTNGILPMVALAREHGITTVFVPAVDAQHAALVEGVTIIPVEHLAALVGHLRGEAPIAPAQPLALDLDVEPAVASDLAAERGQEHVKRALEVAAAGGRSVPVDRREAVAARAVLRWREYDGEKLMWSGGTRIWKYTSLPTCKPRSIAGSPTPDAR